MNVTIPADLAEVITALALVVTAVASIIAARRSGRTEKKADAIATNVNGAAHAADSDRKARLEEIEGLKAQLAQLVVERKDERAASQQARADVQAGIAAPPPEDE